LIQKRVNIPVIAIVTALVVEAFSTAALTYKSSAELVPSN
jgi:hypothetical protein